MALARQIQVIENVKLGFLKWPLSHVTQFVADFANCVSRMKQSIVFLNLQKLAVASSLDRHTDSSVSVLKFDLSLQPFD